MLEVWLNHVASWCEQKDVPFKAWRDEMGDWFAALEFKDANGWFSTSVGYFERRSVDSGDVTKSGKAKQRKETDDEYHDRIAERLQHACADARRKRVIKLTGCDPSRRAA